VPSTWSSTRPSAATSPTGARCEFASSNGVLRDPTTARAKQGEPMVWVVKRYATAKDVVGNRYNCSMCHTPQATNVKTPKNRFVRVKAPK
jgi:cytochrome c